MTDNQQRVRTSSLTELEARADIPERSVAVLSGPGARIELNIPALGERVWTRVRASSSSLSPTEPRLESFS